MMDPADLSMADGGPEGCPARPDPAASLVALSWCLRAIASGWQLHLAERGAALALLQLGLPDMKIAELAAARRLIQRAAKQGLDERARVRASEFSVRLAHLAAVRQIS